MEADTLQMPAGYIGIICDDTRRYRYSHIWNFPKVEFEKSSGSNQVEASKEFDQDRTPKLYLSGQEKAGKYIVLLEQVELLY